MHVLRTDIRSSDEDGVAVDLGQTPGDIVFMSFTDSDMASVAAAWGGAASALPSLRLAPLARLKHPYSVDRYLDAVVRQARIVVVRLLGGLDYWRYGVDELAAAARAGGFALAVVPGDYVEDPRLDEASTLPVHDLRRIWGYFQYGGPANLRNCLQFLVERIGDGGVQQSVAPQPLASFALEPGHCRTGLESGARALVLFYRSTLLADDTRPIGALADALAEHGIAVDAAFVTSLKDPAAIAPLRAHIAKSRPDIILNTTAFSARMDDGGSVLDYADAPVFQVTLAGFSSDQWLQSSRGLGSADLAMNVVLPEMDGRLNVGAVSFKEMQPRHEALEFGRTLHCPQPSRVDFVARLAAAWITLRRTPRAERRLACILSDYPAKGGRTGYAVGLDTPQSVIAMAADLRAAGFDVGAPDSDDLKDGAALMAALTAAPTAVLTRADYARLTKALPPAFVASVCACWGPPEDDPALVDGAFAFPFVRSRNLLVAVQPDRGRHEERKRDYHDAARAPRHAYVAFYLWLREVERVHAIVHAGTHGTLEWLPGKAVALSESCAPEAVLGAVPVVYPFIVNNPGEAAQAKRRTAAVTIGHLTPPMTAAGQHGAALELEGLFDEYAQAQLLDPRRARRLADIILERAAETGLLADSGVPEGGDSEDVLTRLDAWLCDIKEMRIGDGLHVFGRAPAPAGRKSTLACFTGSAADTEDAAARLDGCGEAERAALVRALDGRFVPPGPAGAPSRGRLDVLPTGRNLFTVDPRAVPTRIAWEIGRRTADEILTRYLQDHGDWPRRIIVDLWGSATMRTGGDELAQAMTLLGVRPEWDVCSTRVCGFEILPLARLARPRVDVTLRISGLFRDVFPAQIALFDAIVQAVATLDEPAEENPLAADRLAKARALERQGLPEPRMPRIFGAAPDEHGVGIADAIATGTWTAREELGETYLAAASHAYGRDGDAQAALDAFRERVATADAFVHVQDTAEQDILDSDAFAEHEGGFAAASRLLGGNAALYHVDTTHIERSTVRTLAQEVARVLRGRAINPRWIAGQMRHGHRGAAEIAETLDNLFTFAATTDAVPSHHFDLLFDATLGDDVVRQFLATANAPATRAMAERFEEARDRGFWHARRNSTAALLCELLA